MLISDFRILLVASSRETTPLTREFVENKGYFVESARGLNDALFLLECKKYHLVILEVSDPSVEELGLIAAIKQINAFIDVVLIADSIALHQILTGFKYGLNNCLFKSLEYFEHLEKEIKQTHQKLERARESLNEWVKQPVSPEETA